MILRRPGGPPSSGCPPVGLCFETGSAPPAYLDR
jgi:hypothetical protein